ncbi:Pycsar system effector family protein [Streptomyces violascens]|uniref:Pycsar system effector family protein n=1 Tax=Streptomyces violascens TaxID=67381 RepID=UPI00378F07B1
MATTHDPSTPYTLAQRLRRQAQQALEGHHPERGWPISDGAQRGAGYAALAAATQLADISDRLMCLDITLADAANATRAQTRSQAPDPTATELQVVRGEIARTDTKASILLAALAIVIAPLADKVGALLDKPWPVAGLGAVGALLAAVAAWLLLDVVLPRLHGHNNANFLHYARCTPEELAAILGRTADQHSELKALSEIAVSKYTRLGLAGLLLKLAGLLLVVTTALALAL